jgi:hypothetical protein
MATKGKGRVHNLNTQVEATEAGEEHKWQSLMLGERKCITLKIMSEIRNRCLNCNNTSMEWKEGKLVMNATIRMCGSRFALQEAVSIWNDDIVTCKVLSKKVGKCEFTASNE